MVKEAPRQGSTSPKLTLIEFGDFQCVYCKSVSPKITELLNRRSDDLQYVWIHTINPAHEESEPAAIASQCALEQGKFWEFHDQLFANQAKLSTLLYNQIAQKLSLNTQKFQACLSSTRTREAVRNHSAFAKANDVNSTPTFFLDDKRISDKITDDDLITFIEQALN